MDKTKEINILLEEISESKRKDMIEKIRKFKANRPNKSIRSVRIERAKRCAFGDYVDRMKKHNCHDPKYKREWYISKKDSESIFLALKGTPDKAFVMWIKQEDVVLALRQDSSVIKVF